MPSTAFAHLLRREKERVLVRWELGARTLASAAWHSHPELLNSLPPFLDWLAERLEHPNDTEEADRDAFARHHALERLRGGYDLVELLAEMALLRECLLRIWEEAPQDIAPTEVRRMNEELDDVVALSVVAYVRAMAVDRAAGPADCVPA
ncbi:MAG TPA: hypothetical protein VEY30_10250 [Myxococcaceae bacterium]|nr:hypothetical protein [Myxococcaceae bacterium]